MASDVAVDVTPIGEREALVKDLDGPHLDLLGKPEQ